MRAVLLTLAAVLLTGCGYVGDPLPPALHIPVRVTDLAVVQRSDRLEIRFTAPARTTEDLVIRELRAIDLRIGAVPREFSMEAWAATAKPVVTPLPEPGKTVTVSIPAADWAGREILVAAKFTGSRGRDSEWSNTAVLTPRPTLSPPTLKADLHPEGVRLSWVSGGARVFRGEEAIGTAPGPEYIDRGVELGKTYTYRVQAVDGPVESAPSQPVSITVVDKFAPKAPTGLTAVVGLDGIELAWEPNTEPDLARYRIYRSNASGAFELIADAVDTPAFSDRTAPASGTQRYRVTATDRAGNESEPSSTLDVSR
jgi:hypothetical protein